MFISPEKDFSQHQIRYRLNEETMALRAGIEKYLCLNVFLIREQVIKIRHGIRSGENADDFAVFQHRQSSHIMFYHQLSGLHRAFTRLDGDNLGAHVGLHRCLKLGLFLDFSKIFSGYDPHQLVPVQHRNPGAPFFFQNFCHIFHLIGGLNREHRKRHQIADLNRSLTVSFDEFHNHGFHDFRAHLAEHGGAGAGMPATAKAFHNSAHVNPVNIAPADNNAALLMLVDKKYQRPHPHSEFP